MIEATVTFKISVSDEEIEDNGKGLTEEQIVWKKFYATVGLLLGGDMKKHAYINVFGIPQ